MPENVDEEKQSSAEIARRLRRLDVCAVSDAFDRLGLSGIVTGIPQASGSGLVAGRITTVKLGVGVSPPGLPRHLGTTAIEACGPDDVIVVEQRTGRNAGSWGGILTLGAKLRGVAGVVVDGPVRDIDEARGHDFPIFTRSFTAFTARGRVTEIGTNLPIVFEGMSVAAGDYVVADASGIAFITAACISEVITAAEQISAKEAAMAKSLMDGAAIGSVMGGNYEDLLKG